ncbi:guanine deaminase [Xylariomycetidae sp. FL2044]|nr:guanine deaminase [Xylariomycetidae sp. FL2044]
MGIPDNDRNQLFLGTFVHSKKLDELEYLHDTAVCVDKAGKIVAVEPACERARAERDLFPKLGWEPGHVSVTECDEGQFFFPGFIDTHIHASQYPNTGLFGKTTLLDWLNTYTFPMEASLSSLPRARKVYTRCIRRTLAHGTTTAAYYATISVPSTNLLADLCLAHGQRALIGRVCMDALGPPTYLDATPEAGLAATRRCIAHVRARDPGAALLRPVITPRFAPACTPPYLAALGRLVAETGLPVQTHVSENAAEVDLVARLFPGAASYAAVYVEHGLLTPRTVLAHAIHLSDAEADLIAGAGAGVAHCPCSNSALTSGEARVRWLLDRGIAVGLGTDVSGGYSASVLEAARLAKMVSNHLAMPGKGKKDGGGGEKGRDGEESGDERARLSVDEVLYLATRGGAGVLGLGDRVGRFEVGMEWDAQLIGLGRVCSIIDDDDDEEEEEMKQPEEIEEEEEEEEDQGNVEVFGWETWEERVAKWVFNGDDRNTKSVWVRGRLVHRRRG